MRVDSAQIVATAQQAAMQRTIQTEALEFWVGDRAPGAAGSGVAPAVDRLTLSHAGQAIQPLRLELTGDHEILTPRDSLIAEIVREMIKALTGQELKLFSPKEFADKISEAQAGTETTSAQLPPARPAAPAPTGPGSAGFGLAYDRYVSYQESESLSYSAEGTIKTRDGAEIHFSVHFNISRDFSAEHRTSLRLGDARKIDPLVVNFDGNAAELSEYKFAFDLDSDGREEQIALLKPGSGLLALDKDGDGKITTGRELFGTQSGNGFAELAQYDNDANGFIDEGDDIYHKLRIWTRDEQGRQQLLALGASGIGAIHLGHLVTPFAYKDGTNSVQGYLAATGLFLREDGSGGTIQHIDYAV